MAIMNNGYLGMVRQWQELFYKDNYVSVAMAQPDFVKLADAYGIHGIRVTEKEQVDAAIQRGERAPRPGAPRLPGRGRGQRLADGARGRRAEGDRRERRRQPSEVTAMKHTVVALVEDRPGVLNRVASLFRRRGFNIDSLAVGTTEEPGISRMTIVVDGARAASSSRSRSSSTS